ncbi:unnamed protein product [Arabis nemorensis]|uniref:Leucine-rich repeat-containing N-terminal plant-type domain-containing protein n=1 Tax=Arabis nemorensis TaxID=586526 RepID=A0A565BAF5_9BRAS|nr:unnamed protein product [Arabis nemorensis]
MNNPLLLGILLCLGTCLDALPDPSSNGTEEMLIFLDQRLAVAYPVIQRFKLLITLDPFKITQTWIGSDICSYRGFYCDNPPDNKTALTVASIDFNGFQLSAPSIEGFVDQLPDLALFHVNSNNFGGTVPTNIVNLKYLYELDISNNRFTGQFPTAVLDMPGLTYLDIRFNSFSGSIPPQIFSKSLDVLFVNDNGFTASLPDIPEDDGGAHILYLTLANNKLKGPLPSSVLRSMSSLSEVVFLNNDFTGCIPYEIGFLKGASVIDIGGNKLTGPLPFSLTCLEKVEQLNFAGNLLFGVIPEPVCMLLRDNLVNLSLSDNYFTHLGPWCRGLVETGVLDVRNNCLPFFFPGQRSMKECAEFFLKRPKYYCPHRWFNSFIPCRYSLTSSRDEMPMVAPSP